uniref:Polyprotein n=1 Tax=Insectivora picornavirus TaxID=3039002 RepID=A0AAT9TY00_9PICO|nr:MAG: polyprotein [Insectivora picornavirus]
MKTQKVVDLDLEKPLIRSSPQKEYLALRRIQESVNLVANSKLPPMEYEGIWYFVSPKFSNITKNPISMFSREWHLCAQADLSIFEGKLKGLGIVTDENEQYFQHWTKPITTLPTFVSYALTGLVSSNQKFKEVIGHDNLLHFLQTHSARRRFFRQHTYVHFNRDLFETVFPCGLATNTEPRTRERCPYHCRWFYQNCRWHEGLHDEELMERRSRFKDDFSRERENPDLWCSLVMEVNVEYNRQHAGHHVETENKTRAFLRRYYQNTSQMVDEGWEELYDDLVRERQHIQGSYDLTKCTHCSLSFTRGFEMKSHLKVHHSRDMFDHMTDWAEYARNTIVSQINMLMDVWYQAKKQIPAWLSKYKMLIVNTFFAMIVISRSKDWAAILAGIGIITTHLIESFGEKVKAPVGRLASSLKEVMQRFVTPTGQQAQAVASREADQTVANETFLTTVFEVISTLFGTGHDADLLKARMDRIKQMGAILTTAASIAGFFILFLERIWRWIQIYFFGASEDELDDAMRIVTSGDVSKWIKEVNDFELKKMEDGMKVGVPSLITDKEAQMKVVQLKKKGEQLIAALSLNGMKTEPELMRILTAHHAKVQSWFKIFESSLGAFGNKQEPFIIFLHGDPGVGKTFITRYIVQFLSAAAGREFDEKEDIFTKPRTSPYFDGYRGNFCFVLDDFLQVQDTTGNAADLGFLIDAGSRAKYHLDMSGVEHKSISYFCSPLVIITSNTSLTPSEYEGKLSSYAALSRRIDLSIEVRNDPNHKRDHTAMFDNGGLHFHMKTFKLDHEHKDGGYWTDLCDPVDWYLMRNMVTIMFLHKQKKQAQLDKIEPLLPQTGEILKDIAGKYITPSSNQYTAALSYFTDHAKQDHLCEWGKRNENGVVTETMATFVLNEKPVHEGKKVVLNRRMTEKERKKYDKLRNRMPTHVIRNKVLITPRSSEDEMSRSTSEVEDVEVQSMPEMAQTEDMVVQRHARSHSVETEDRELEPWLRHLGDLVPKDCATNTRLPFPLADHEINPLIAAHFTAPRADVEFLEREFKRREQKDPYKYIQPARKSEQEASIQKLKEEAARPIEYASMQRRLAMLGEEVEERNPSELEAMDAQIEGMMQREGFPVPLDDSLSTDEEVKKRDVPQPPVPLDDGFSTDQEIKKQQTKSKKKGKRQVRNGSVVTDLLSGSGSENERQSAQAMRRPNHQCHCPNLLQVEAEGVEADSLLNTVIHLLKLKKTPDHLRLGMVRYYNKKHPVEFDWMNPWTAQMPMSLEHVPDLADGLQVAICVHVNAPGIDVHTRMYEPDLGEKRTVPELHVVYDGRKFSPMVQKLSEKKYRTATNLVINDPVNDNVVCPVKECLAHFHGRNVVADLYHHMLVEARDVENLGYQHQGAMEQMEELYNYRHYNVGLLSPTLQQRLKAITEVHTCYQPPHSPWSLAHFIQSSRWDMCESIARYYEAYEVKSVFQRMSEVPVNAATSVWSSCQTAYRTIVNRVFSPLKDIGTLLIRFKGLIQDTLDSIKKWAIFGMFIAIGGSAMYAFTKWWQKPGKKSKSRERSVEQEDESDEDPVSKMESDKLSKPAKVSAARRIKQKIESEDFTPEGELRPEIRYACTHRLANPNESYRLIKVDVDQAEVEIVYVVRDGKKYIQFHNRITGEMEETEQSHDNMHWWSKKFQDMAQMKKAQLTQAFVDLSVPTTRLDLVNKALFGLPVAEAAIDATMIDVVKKTMDNIFVVMNVTDGMTVRGFFIKNHTAIMPGHIIGTQSLEEGFDALITTKTAAALPIRISSKNAMSIPEKDMIIVDLSKLCLPAKPSLVRCFVRESDQTTVRTGYINVPHLGEGNTVRHIWSKQLTNIRPLASMEYENNLRDETIRVIKAVSYNGPTVAGDCGSLVFAEDCKMPRKILGFHVAGGISGATGIMLTQEFLEEALKQFEVQEMQAVLDLPLTQCENSDEFFDAIDQKWNEAEECEEYLDLPYIEYVGDVKKEFVPHMATKTKLMKSPLYGKIVEPKSEPARQKPFKDEEGNVIDPYRIALSKLQCRQIMFDPKIVNLVAQRMVVDYNKRGLLRPYDRTRRGKLNDKEIITGIEGDKWVRPLHRLTSPGYPYSLYGGKEKFIDFENAEMGDLLRRAYEHRLETLKRGEQIPAITVDIMKDERLPSEKVRKGKVRIFNPLPLDHTLVTRKYFTKFCAQMMDKHIDGEVSVGINCHADEWEALYRRLKARGHYWIAGDYSAWDKRAPLQVAIAALSVVEAFYQQFDDYQPTDALVRRTLIEQAYTSIHLAARNGKGFLYRAHQCMPSGIAVTAVYNSIVNSLLFRVIYAELAMKQGLSLGAAVNTFDQHVEFVAYGDDHIARVSQVVIGWFNMESIARQMATHGIVYTSADKEDTFSAWVEDCDLQYLKRKFVKNGLSPRIDAPMDLGKVLDILNWVQAKDEDQAKEACASAIRSVLIELTHHPKEVFEEWNDKIVKAAVKAEVEVYITDYHTALNRRLTMDPCAEDWEWF